LRVQKVYHGTLSEDEVEGAARLDIKDVRFIDGNKDGKVSKTVRCADPSETESDIEDEMRLALLLYAQMM
jgi:hypothetical protein